MVHGYPIRRVRRGRSHRRRRLVRRVAVGALLVLVALGGLWTAFRGSRHSDFSDAALAANAAQRMTGQRMDSFTVDPDPKASKKRIVYPYSIQPGGIHSPQELKELRKHDRVIDNHFAGFDYDRAAVVELKEPKMMYLSYRVGNKVFWTKKRVALRKGEKVLTDGKITARTRCANRVSELPQGDVSPAEPMAQKFEDPFGAGGSAIQIPYPGEFESALFGRGPFDGLNNAGPPPGGGPPLGPPGGGGFPGVSPPPIPGSCTPPPPQQPPPSCNHPPPPPPPVPEPGTIVLVFTGLAGTYLRYRNVKSRK